MTTQVDSSSPFTGSADSVQQTPDKPEEFSIRTMRDDLLALKGKTSPVKTIKEVPGPETKNIPKVEMPEKVPVKQPLPPQPIEPKQVAPIEAPAQVIRPFVEKVAETDKKKIVEIPLQTKTAGKESTSGTKNITYKIFLAAIVILIIAVIGLGGYYFWITRAPQQPAAAVAPTETPAPVETPVITPPAEKYSQEKPNYLALDLSTLSSDDIKKTISTAAAELKDKINSRPYEFVVVDNNNNPVAFPIFATAAKLNLSPAILDSLGEGFSLFLYNDAGDVRLAAAVDIAKASALTVALPKQEKTFITDAAFLFLDAKPEITSGTFKSNAQNSAIKYINLNSQMTLSIDYTVSNNKLIIATSKNTMQAVLDKTSQAASSVVPVSDNTTTTTKNNDGSTTSTTEAPIGTVSITTDAPTNNETPEFLAFIEKFKNCEPTVFTTPVTLGAAYTYQIIGPKNGRCEITTSYPTNPNPKWVNQKMTCLYDNTKDFQTAIMEFTTAFSDNSLFSCSGPLFDLMKNPTT